MSAKVSSSEISQAILQHVEYKAYPESEQTATAELSSSNLPDIIDAIGKERENVRVCVSGHSLLVWSLMRRPSPKFATSAASPPKMWTDG